MKYISKLAVRIIVAVLIGFLFAGVGTQITYTCMPTDSAAGCVSFDKAIDHPSDLVNNKQDSLTHFYEAFTISSLASFAILSIADFTYKTKSIAHLKD